MYLPAYDYPAIQNPFFAYSEYFEQKSKTALKLSSAVFASVYQYDVSRLYEQPTPAGD